MKEKLSTLLTLLCPLILCAFFQAAHGWQNPETANEKEQIQLVDFFAWYERKPAALEIQYDLPKFQGKIVLNVYGYTERNASKISKIHTPFALLTTLPVPETSTGTLDLIKMGVSCNGKEAECNKFDMGYLEIAPDKDENFTRKENQISQIVPLGWLAEKSYAVDKFEDWPYGKCKHWYDDEVKNEVKSDLFYVSCPVNMVIANNDPAWFSKASYLAGFPSPSKRTGSGVGNSSTNPQPDQTCFYSAISDVANGSHTAPASMCCYRNSDHQLLSKEFTTEENLRLHGSSVLRSHPFGLDSHIEHYKPGQVPYLSHWFWDKLPFLYCCHWWKNGNACSSMYLDMRPVPKIRGKSKTTSSTVAYVAESHVYPLHGKAATFCHNVGEFWMVRSPAIQVQIRKYVISRYRGSDLANPSTKHPDFITAASRGTFVTAVAMRSMEAPEMVMELTCPEGEFHCYVQVTNKNSSQTWSYEGTRGRALGTRVLVGDVTEAAKSKKYTFMVKHSLGRVAVIAYVVEPNEEFMSLAVTVPESLMGNVTGLALDGNCLNNQVESADDRLFGAACENCEDFAKYKTGRPLYFEDMDAPDRATPPQQLTGECTTPVCKYITWATNYIPYFKSVAETKTKELEVLQSTLVFVGSNGSGSAADAGKAGALKDELWEACENPNRTGLYISPDQKFNPSASLELKCIPPLTSSHAGQKAKCEKVGEKLQFNIPSDFVCAKSEVVIKAEEKAASADQVYTKKHYSPEKAKEEAKKRAVRGRDCSELLTIAALIGFIAALRHF